MSESEIFVSVGRRKTSVARVRLTKGSGKIMVNDKPLKDYLATEKLINIATLPLQCVSMLDTIDADVNVQGGGMAGQAVAISHGFARSLQKMDSTLRAALKAAGYITRDPRAKERKKSGQPGARKRFQFSKR